jgi:hypothetical protein
MRNKTAEYCSNSVDFAEKKPNEMLPIFEAPEPGGQLQNAEIDPLI